MSFATAEEVETIRGIWGTVLGRDFEAARDWALQRLREDLTKPDDSEHPDAYLYRANAVPLGLMGANQFAMADAIYEKLIAEVDEFNKSRRLRKHRGALLANQAVCRILLGSFDRGIPQLVFTIEEEDPKTFGESQSTTPAMRHLEDLFEARARRIIGLWCESLWFKAAGSRPETAAIEDMARLLMTGRWSLFASVIRTQELWESYQSFPSSYAAPRLLDGLRALCGSFEHLVKAVGKRSAATEVSTYFAKASTLTLVPSLRKLFGQISPPWWPAVDRAVNQGLTSFDSAAGPNDFSAKLVQVTSWPARNLDELTTRCFTTTALCRNYVSHELEPPLAFLTSESYPYPPLFIRAVTACTASLVLLPQMARLFGHLRKDAND